MTWKLTMLFVHLAGLGVLPFLYRKAPCWMQQLVVVGLTLSFATFSAGYLALVLGVWEGWLILGVAAALEHVAVLLYVFRLTYQDRVQWTSAHSSSLPR